MSKTTRWILAVLMALGSVLCVGVGGMVVWMPVAFGTTCLIEWLFLPPIVTLLCALAGSVMFGMNKPRSLWLGTMALGLVLGAVGIGVWFAVASRLCG